MSKLTVSMLRLLHGNPLVLNMHNSNAISASAHRRQTNFLRQMRNVLLQKLWLPKIIYEALPYFYLVMGLVALASAVYMPGWAWLLPYAMLFGLACLHVSIALIALRYNFRRNAQTCRRDDTEISS